MQILQRSLKSRFSFVSFRLWKSTMQHTIDSDKPDRIDDHQNQNLAKLYTKRQTHRVLSSNAFRYPCSSGSGVVALQGFPRKPIRHWASSSSVWLRVGLIIFSSSPNFSYFCLFLRIACMTWDESRKYFFSGVILAKQRRKCYVAIVRFSAGLIKLLQ